MLSNRALNRDYHVIEQISDMAAQRTVIILIQMITL